MNEAHLSKRLQTVANYVPRRSRLADIGSDHGYLPTWLYLNGRLDFGLAGEVVKGPYQSAKKVVKKNDLEQVISVRLGDGLDVIQPEQDEISVITIAGMGGVLIRDILERGKRNKKLTGKERLILQPNVAEKSLRVWLQVNRYEILAEELIEEDGKRYEVIVAERDNDNTVLTDKELFFGPYLLKEKSSVFVKKWCDEYQKRCYVLEQLKKATVSQHERIKFIEQELHWIREEIRVDEC